MSPNPSPSPSILALPISQYDLPHAEAPTVGAYLAKLLTTLLAEDEGFDPKRPFGNSGWIGNLEDALLAANQACDPEMAPASIWDDLYAAIHAALSAAFGDAPSAPNPHTAGPAFVAATVTGNGASAGVGTSNGADRYVVLKRVAGRSGWEYIEYGQFRDPVAALATAAALNEAAPNGANPTEANPTESNPTEAAA